MFKYTAVADCGTRACVRVAMDAKLTVVGHLELHGQLAAGAPEHRRLHGDLCEENV